MESIENKMPDLTEREKKVLNKHTKSIINQLLKEPILQVKELAMDPRHLKSLQCSNKFLALMKTWQKKKKCSQIRRKNGLRSGRKKTLRHNRIDILTVCQRGVSACRYSIDAETPLLVWKGRGIIMADLTMARLHELMVVFYAISLVFYFIDYLNKDKIAHRSAFWIFSVVYLLQTTFLVIYIIETERFPVLIAF